MRTKRSAFTSFTVGLVALVSLAACGESTQAAESTKTTTATTAAAAGGATADSSATTAAPTDGSAAEAPKTDEQKGLAFAKCMRDQGLDWPDPTVDAKGAVQFGSGGGAGGGIPALVAQPGFQAASDKCQPLLDGASFLPSASDNTEFQDSLLKVAKCLRDKGFDVTDPDLSGGIGAVGGDGPFGKNFDVQDPKNQEAFSACQKEFNLTIPGQGS